MTRKKAQALMKEGKKIRHRFFIPDEWITEISGVVVDEQGNQLTTFWEYRDMTKYDDGWEIYTPNTAL
jgi:hypothetical protein